MTWSKKQNTRAYEPIAVVSVTPSAGNISGLSVVEAYYTVDNDYICHFNLYVIFTQNATAAGSYLITAPLGLVGAANGPVGNGTFYISNHQSAWVERDSATAFRVYPMAGATIAAGSNVQLRILGQFAVR